MEIVSALSGLKTAIDIAKTAIALRDDAKISQATQGLNDRIIEVQNAVISLQGTIDSLRSERLALTERVRELEGAMKRDQEFEADLANFERYITARGGVCYREKEPPGHPRNSVFICATCVSLRRKTYLQPVKDGYFLDCPNHGEVPSDMSEAAHDAREAAKRQIQYGTIFGR